MRLRFLLSLLCVERLQRLETTNSRSSDYGGFVPGSVARSSTFPAPPVCVRQDGVASPPASSLGLVARPRRSASSLGPVAKLRRSASSLGLVHVILSLLSSSVDVSIVFAAVSLSLCIPRSASVFVLFAEGQSLTLEHELFA